MLVVQVAALQFGPQGKVEIREKTAETQCLATLTRLDLEGS